MGKEGRSKCLAVLRYVNDLGRRGGRERRESEREQRKYRKKGERNKLLLGMRTEGSERETCPPRTAKKGKGKGEKGKAKGKREKGKNGKRKKRTAVYLTWC
jgi:hypothetical protein